MECTPPPRYRRWLRAPLILSLILLGYSCASPPQAPAARSASDGTLQNILETFNEEIDSPAWVAAVVTEDRIVATAAAGIREFEKRSPVDPNTDRFHLGSITKSVTATMIASLVEDGDLAWDAELATLLPDIPMRAEYGRATLADLLSHRANLPTYALLGPDEARQLSEYTGAPTERRRGFVEDVLLESPPSVTRKELNYSNAGPAVAAYIAESATGETWEMLVQAHVFDPLGMTSAGVGQPWRFGPEQPTGHYGPDGATLTPAPANPMIGSQILGPSGDTHSTIEDAARYARAHLWGLRGNDGFLSAATIKYLHTPPSDQLTLRGGGYALGWGLREEPDGARAHWHNGSAGAFFAQINIYPEQNIAIVVMSNAGFAGRHAPNLIDEIRMAFS